MFNRLSTPVFDLKKATECFNMFFGDRDKDNRSSLRRTSFGEGHWRKLFYINDMYMCPQRQSSFIQKSKISPRSSKRTNQKLNKLDKFLFWKRNAKKERGQHKHQDSTLVNQNDVSKVTISAEGDNDKETFLQSLCTAWRPRENSGSSCNAYSQKSSVYSDGSGFDNAYENGDRNVSKNCQEEFLIPYKDLWVKRLIKFCKIRSLYRGCWHGEVDIHMYHASYASGRYEFWSLVTKLYRVRHENIVMFMGAVVEADKIAIVLGSPGGPSLYDTIHKETETITMNNKMSILKQIVNGVGFLHAKNIVAQNLCSRNIFLCPEVKVSLVDYSSPKIPDGQHGCKPPCFLLRGQLTYLAPEIVRNLEFHQQEIKMPNNFSCQSDVYAFGTLTYELLIEEFPYHGLETEVVLWRLYKGILPTLEPEDIPKLLQELISACWSYDETDRPSFIYINKVLSRTSALFTRQSLSEPEKINRLGLEQWLQ